MKVIKLSNELLGLQESYQYKEFIKIELTGAKWLKDKKMWQVEFSIGNIDKLLSIRCDIPEEIIEEYQKKKEVMKQVTAEKLIDKTEPIEEMPIKVKPYQHQIKAFNIACKLMNLFKEGEK